MKKILVVLVCVACLAGANVAYGSVGHAPAAPDSSAEVNNRIGVAADRAPSNPSDKTKTVSLKAISFTLDNYAASSSSTHAANGGSLFSDFTPFLEYGYGRSRSRSSSGLTNNIHTATAGFTFRTLADLQAGGIFTVSHTNGDGNNSNVDYDEDGFTATLFVSKNLDWFYFGTSLTYGYSAGIARIKPVNTRFRTKIDSNTFAVSPFVGAIYISGSFCASVTPTYVYRYQDVAYRSGINTSTSENISDGTFILANRVSYAFSDRLIADLNLNLNQIVHDDGSRYATRGPDRTWLTIGPRATYKLSSTMQVYAGYTAAVANQDFEDHQIDIGFEVNF